MSPLGARLLLLRRVNASISPARSAAPRLTLTLPYSSKATDSSASEQDNEYGGVIPSEGISRPLAEVLSELGKKVPESLIRTKVEDGFSVRYVPWHVINRILNMHAPEWSSEVRNIIYSSDGKSVSVVYRVTLYGTDAEIYREATGTCNMDDTTFGDPVQKAESMAFRRACARLGLGLHLYHEELA